MKVEVEFDNGNVIGIENIAVADISYTSSEFYYDGFVSGQSKEKLNSDEIKRITIEF